MKLNLTQRIKHLQQFTVQYLGMCMKWINDYFIEYEMDNKRDKNNKNKKKNQEKSWKYWRLCPVVT